MSTKQKIASFELGRVIAILAVITIHSQLFLTYPLYNETAWLGNIVNQICRFAVPFFFILSGYLLQPKLTSTPVQTAIQYIKPLSIVWVVWSLIYLASPFNLSTFFTEGYLAERQGYWGFLGMTPLNSLLEGGMVHLWYLPALMISVAIIAIMQRLGLGVVLVPLGLVLFVYGVLAGSYAELTSIASPFYTRNGPFFSLLMLVIGFEIRRNNWHLSKRAALLLAIIGMSLHFAEAFWLYQYGVDFRIHDLLFGTPIWGAGIFMFLLASPNLGNSAWVHKLAPYTLGIYVSHLLLFIYLSNIAGLLKLEFFAKDASLWIGTVIVSIVFVWGVNKTPLKNVLLR